MPPHAVDVALSERISNAAAAMRVERGWFPAQYADADGAMTIADDLGAALADHGGRTQEQLVERLLSRLPAPPG